LIYFQKFYISNSVDLVEKVKNAHISENKIVSSFDEVSMYTTINVTIFEQLLKNKIEESYHLIEVSRTGTYCEI
jgi:hypothetical protein